MGRGDPAGYDMGMILVMISKRKCKLHDDHMVTNICGPFRYQIVEMRAARIQAIANSFPHALRKAAKVNTNLYVFSTLLLPTNI